MIKALFITRTKVSHNSIAMSIVHQKQSVLLLVIVLNHYSGTMMKVEFIKQTSTNI